jgi:diguanylate cyclase (GGDEF)-like protein
MNEHDANKERLELALEAAGLDLWENDLIAGLVTRKASKIYRELGYAEPEIASYVDDIFAIVHPDDVPVIKSALSDHLAAVTPQYRCEFRLRSKSGEWVWYANYGKIMDRDQADRGRRFIGVTFNIDDRKRREKELEEINRKLTGQNRLLENMNTLLQSLAATDSLTGIANRRKFLEVGESEFRRARRFGHPLSLLIADIDEFKRINDAWGHPVGDRVIRVVADTCVRNVRGTLDVVGRIGGDEFAIVLPETDYASASELAERLRQMVATELIAVDDGESIACAISVGVATLAGNVNSFDDLMVSADKALYRAKSKGRNRVHGTA